MARYKDLIIHVHVAWVPLIRARAIVANAAAVEGDEKYPFIRKRAYS